MDSDELEVVEEFVYLGSVVTADNTTSKEIQQRFQAGLLRPSQQHLEPRESDDVQTSNRFLWT